MKKTLTLIAFVVSAPVWAAKAPLSDSKFDANFRCPEALPTAEDRDQAVLQFINWAQEAHGDWTIPQVLAFRMQLLEKHDCQETLENIRAQEQEYHGGSN
jgi:hypothetical protein